MISATQETVWCACDFITGAVLLATSAFCITFAPVQSDYKTRTEHLSHQSDQVPQAQSREHICSLHASCSSFAPAQSAPAPAASFFVRLRERIPPPHVTEQEAHSLHAFHTQSAGQTICEMRDNANECAAYVLVAIRNLRGGLGAFGAPVERVCMIARANLRTPCARRRARAPLAPVTVRTVGR